MVIHQRCFRQITFARMLALGSVIALSLSIAPSFAFAQPLFGHAESIEYQAAHADHIVLATIVDISDFDESTGTVEVELSISETLKGEHSDKRRITLQYPKSIVETWTSNEHELLLFGRNDNPVCLSVIDLSGEELVVLTEDLVALTDRKAVVEQAKRAIAQLMHHESRGGFSLAVPYEAVAGTSLGIYYGTGGRTQVVVPINEKLQTRARKLASSDRYLECLDGANALSYFKNDENIAILKGLLDDPKWAYERHAQYNFGIEVHHFGIRKAAYESLKEWGLDIERPVFREEHERFDLVQLIVLDDEQVKSGMINGLGRFENLDILYVSNTSVGDEDLKTIATYKKIRDLNLAGTSITDEGLKHLISLKSLKYLHVANTKVTEMGLSGLMELLPDLEINP